MPKMWYEEEPEPEPDPEATVPEPADVPVPAPVPDLTAAIIGLHGLITELGGTLLSAAITLGEMLTEERRRRRKTFLKYVKDKLPFTVRTAQRYMRLHRHRDRLEAAGVRGVKEGYKVLAAPSECDTVSHSPRPRRPVEGEPMTARQRGRSVRDWVNQVEEVYEANYADLTGLWQMASDKDKAACLVELGDAADALVALAEKMRANVKREAGEEGQE
jgi:hypothetical protein